MNYMGQVLVLMIFAFCFFVLGLLLWRRLESQKMRAKVQCELQAKLLDKATSVQEGHAILQAQFGIPGATTTGRASLDFYRQLQMRNLYAVQLGILLVVVGTGIIFLSRYVYFGRDWIVMGGFCLTLGIGLFISTAASNLLAKNMGLRPTALSDKASENMK